MRTSLLLAAGALALSAPSAAATPTLRCGQTITRDTRLTADLVNCPATGITIDANNVTLDLNGHTVDGVGRESGVVIPAGIAIAAGRRGVSVSGGTIRDFVDGLHVFDGGAHTLLRDLTVTQNVDFGILVEGSSDTVIAGTRATHNRWGILLTRSHGGTVTRNKASGNGADTGILLFDETNDTVADNQVEDNDIGIALIGGGGRNAVLRNRVTHNAGSAIDVSDSGNLIEANHSHDNGHGVTLAGTEANDNVVRGNVITATGRSNPEPGGLGITVADGASRNRIERNVVTGGAGPAIFVTEIETDDIASRNAIVGNVANSKAYTGIFVGRLTAGTLVAHNTAWGNPLDGIEITAPATTVTANLAFRNGRNGIIAVPGVTDGGGNHAFGNGIAQCIGIAC
jgi:parallel beta-helix repeat protein